MEVNKMVNIKNPLRGSGSRRRFSCRQDKQTNAVKCESWKEMPDGTKVRSAEIEFELGSHCNPVPTIMEEYEDGELEKLEKRVMNKVVAKCKKVENAPSDY